MENGSTQTEAKAGAEEGREAHTSEASAKAETEASAATANEENVKASAEQTTEPEENDVKQGSDDLAVQEPGPITLEMLMLPQKFKIVEVLDSVLLIKTVRSILSKRLSVPFWKLTLTSREGQRLTDEQRLGTYAVADKVQIIGAVNETTEDVKYRVPSTIEVMVDTSIDGRPVMINVDVVRQEGKKTFLGGFRDRRNGLEYHHGTTQTIRRRPGKTIEKSHRETQTVMTSSKSAQSKREQGTQMARRDLYTDNSGDQIVPSEEYFTTEKLMELKEEKAIRVQCFIRQCFAWRKVAQEYNSRVAAAEKAERDAKEAEEKAKREEEDRVQRRINPRTKADFQALYDELKKWSIQQKQLISKNEEMTDGEKKLAKAELVRKEVKLLQTIEKLKIKANSKNKEDLIQVRLELMASPKEWLNSQGDFIEVITPFTTRAAELVQMYNGLKLRKVTDEQRVDILLNVKYTVKEFDCNLTREIMELTIRERDMLSRGRPASSLVGLRKRLENLFLQFIETPDFNPGSASFQRVPHSMTSVTQIKTKSSTMLYTRKQRAGLQ